MSFTPGQQVKLVAFIQSNYPVTPYSASEQSLVLGIICIFDFETKIEGIFYAGITHPAYGSFLWPYDKIVAV